MSELNRDWAMMSNDVKPDISRMQQSAALNSYGYFSPLLSPDVTSMESVSQSQHTTDVEPRNVHSDALIPRHEHSDAMLQRHEHSDAMLQRHEQLDIRKLDTEREGCFLDALKHEHSHSSPTASEGKKQEH